MYKFLFLSRKLKWLGLLGLPMFFSDMAVWKILWQFWLFAFVEIFYNFPVFIQSLKQTFGIFQTQISHKFSLPGINNYRSSLLYSLPFSGEWTVANGGAVKSVSHSWLIFPQRYAYDFLILDAEGKSRKKDNTKNEDYFCYGKAVLAAADGIVAEAVDIYPDSQTDKKGNIFCKAKDIRGNYILIRHCENEYSLTAHLKPSSICVKEGMQVKRGDVIALCGNSGNTSEPHIHFQVQNGRSFYTSAGLPIIFKDISIREAENYHKADSRPIKLPKEYPSEYIRRGQNVRNI